MSQNFVNDRPVGRPCRTKHLLPRFRDTSSRDSSFRQYSVDTDNSRAADEGQKEEFEGSAEENSLSDKENNITAVNLEENSEAVDTPVKIYNNIWTF